MVISVPVTLDCNRTSLSYLNFKMMMKRSKFSNGNLRPDLPNFWILDFWIAICVIFFVLYVFEIGKSAMNFNRSGLSTVIFLNDAVIWRGNLCVYKKF